MAGHVPKRNAAGIVELDNPLLPAADANRGEVPPDHVNVAVLFRESCIAGLIGPPQHLLTRHAFVQANREAPLLSAPRKTENPRMPEHERG